MRTDDVDAPARRGVVICLFCREHINAETHPQDPGVCRESLGEGDAAPDYTQWEPEIAAVAAAHELINGKDAQ